jgi:hypothetical protein
MDWFDQKKAEYGMSGKVYLTGILGGFSRATNPPTYRSS